eukprot:TRINITY_DN11287_c0_g1_i1.p1 TRINITY_DN11287_c0_g1~~TRINITY_DN11287_c0_g1_i1.p1  ORF type:complete len:159 (-),score=37.05 TRINITY_DN11287_c0_g1_i1:34-510(-)
MSESKQLLSSETLISIGLSTVASLSVVLGALYLLKPKAKEPINIPGKPVVPVYTPSVKSNGFVFLSGNIGRNSKNELPQDFVEQAENTMNNTLNVLRSAGKTFDDVVKVNVFLTDMDHYQAFNDVYKKYFNGDPPARSAVQVAGLPLGALIELECIAA